MTFPNFTGGYAFDSTLSYVVCIHKNRPAKIAGMLWVPGGFVETGEDMFYTQRREFEEEAGIVTKSNEWSYVTDFITDNGRMIRVLYAVDDKFMGATTQTDEKIEILPVDEVVKRTDLVPEFVDMLGCAVAAARSNKLGPAC